MRKSDSKLVMLGKMALICIICFGTIYGIVSLITYLSA